MEKIRIESNIKEIEVNDNGDTILIPMGDLEFIDKLYITIDTLANIAEEVKNFNDGTAADDMRFIIDKSKEAACNIDDLLGADACMKVFGVKAPMIDSIFDFLGQLVPMFADVMDARHKSIVARYSKSRKGARSK